MIRNFFITQIDYFRPITKEVLDKAEFKTVWSGKRIEVGDKVLIALVYEIGTDNLKAITFLERELEEISGRFNFVKFEFEDNQGLPILSFKEDGTKRQ